MSATPVETGWPTHVPWHHELPGGGSGFGSVIVPPSTSVATLSKLRFRSLDSVP
jgi:hypothetical protein